MSKGRLVVISAPSGAGKTTIIRRLQQDGAQWRFSVSATTRPRRSAEVDGEDYQFLSDAQFDADLAGGKFIEWEWVHGHRYGTLRSSLETALAAERTLLLDVDVKGAVNIMRSYPGQCLGIFIDPPDVETLTERLRDRGSDDPQRITKRLERLPEELAYKPQFDYVVVNDDLDQAVDRIRNIIRETA